MERRRRNFLTYSGFAANAPPLPSTAPPMGEPRFQPGAPGNTVRLPPIESGIESIKTPFYRSGACRTFVKWRFGDWMISVCRWMQTHPLCLRPTPPPLTRSPDLGQSTRGRRFYVQEKRQLATGLRVLCRTRTCAMKVSHWIFARLRLPTNPVRLLFPSKEGR